MYELVQHRATPSECNEIAVPIRAYRGSDEAPSWLDEDSGTLLCNKDGLYLTTNLDSFTELCTIHADTSKATKALPARRSSTGDTYYSIQFKVVLLFGLTELKAQLSWLEGVRAIYCICEFYCLLAISLPIVQSVEKRSV